MPPKMLRMSPRKWRMWPRQLRMSLKNIEDAAETMSKRKQMKMMKTAYRYMESARAVQRDHGFWKWSSLWRRKNTTTIPKLPDQ